MTGPSDAIATRRGPADADRPQSAVRVFYIAGLGRSGSTLLDRMIGQVPGFFSSGEIRDLWQRGLRENRLCGCGDPFRSCPFWTRVGQEAFGGWDNVDLDEVIKLGLAVDRHRFIPLMLVRRPTRRYRKQLQRYAGILGRLYRGIHVAAGGATIVDSSVAPSYAYLLRGIPDIDLRFVHLIRDSRGVAYSWAKKVRRPDTPGRVVYMHRYGTTRTGARWVVRNLLVELLPRLGTPGVRVRYEHLVTNPREEMARIMSNLNGSVPAHDLAFIASSAVNLGANHTVMGNPMRMKSGWITLQIDEAWRSSMGRISRGIVTALTWPVLVRYGYKP
jgi:Sulfotransferase family